jgi:hypothetical protein
MTRLTQTLGGKRYGGICGLCRVKQYSPARDNSIKANGKTGPNFFFYQRLTRLTLDILRVKYKLSWIWGCERKKR